MVIIWTPKEIKENLIKLYRLLREEFNNGKLYLLFKGII